MNMATRRGSGRAAWFGALLAAAGFLMPSASLFAQRTPDESHSAAAIEKALGVKPGTVTEGQVAAVAKVREMGKQRETTLAQVQAELSAAAFTPEQSDMILKDADLVGPDVVKLANGKPKREPLDTTTRGDVRAGKADLSGEKPKPGDWVREAKQLGVKADGIRPRDIDDRGTKQPDPKAGSGLEDLLHDVDTGKKGTAEKGSRLGDVGRAQAEARVNVSGEPESQDDGGQEQTSSRWPVILLLVFELALAIALAIIFPKARKGNDDYAAGIAVFVLVNLLVLGVYYFWFAK
jgi:hypothetical protein